MTNRLSILFLLLFSVLSPGFGQGNDTVSPEEESPEALFDQKIGDVGVVLEAEGTWTSRMAAGWGAGFGSEGMLSGLGYSGYEKGFVFSQKPDFTLTLRLMERYYLEIIYGGSLDDRSFLVGYDGKPGEVVQWFKAGNASFTVPSRAGTTLAEGRRGAPAAAAAFSLGNVDLEVLGRYEDGTRETKTYQGYREVTSSTVALDAWVRNRFFRLPGTAPFSGVQVLVLDPEGSLSASWTIEGAARTGVFRSATDNEVAIDTATGEIRLSATATRTYLVTWSGASAYSSASVTSLLGISAVSATGPSGTWFVLAQPGSASFFEQRNRYPVATGTTGAILLVDRDTAQTVSGHPVTQASTQDWFEVDGGEEAPFYADQGGALRGIYPVTSTGTPPPVTSTLPWNFRLPTASTATSYSLGTDVIATSLVVTRNGMPTTAYQFNASTGILTFDVPVYDTDEVVISLQRTTSANEASDLVLWHGGHWDVAENQSLEWNLQGRMNMEQGKYTTEDLQSPGQVSASLAWKGSAGDWTWSATVTGGALLADSTGHRQIYGQGTSGTEATYDGDSLRPSAAPGTLGSWSLTDTNRAPIYFRDYWTNDPLTGVPGVSAWGKSGISRETWGTDGWMGPFLVRGDGERTDRLAVIDADLDPGQWAGMQVFLDGGKPLDLKAATAVTLVVRMIGGTSGNRVYFQAGALSEDFDGTGTVRDLEYRTHPALGFSDSDGTRRYFPIPEDSSWANDGEGDEAAGSDGSLVTVDLSTASEAFDPTATGWQTVRIVLTDAQRQLLERTSGWRLVVAEAGGGTGTKVLLAGPVLFEGTAWSVVADDTATGTVNPAEVDDTSRTADGRMLRVDWSGRASWSVEGRHSAVRSSSYKTLSFQVRNVSVPNPTTFGFNLTDEDGHGVHATWPVTGPVTATSGWTTVKVNLRTKTLSLDGVEAGTVTIDGGATSWDRMTITKATDDGSSDSGTWFLTEVEATDPVWEPVGSSVVATTWKQSAPWPSADLPLVSGMTFGLTSRQSGLTADDASWKGQTTLAGALGPVKASGEATVTRSTTATAGHGAYEAALPLALPEGPSLTLTEKFSDLGLRSEKVTVGLPWVGTLEASAQAEGPPTTLDQEYRAGWTSPAQWPTGWSGSLVGLWTQTQSTDLELAAFGDQWVESWDWLRPTPNLATYHLVQAKETFKAAAGPWSLETRTTLQAAQTIASTVKWTPIGSWEVKTPIRFGETGGWVLTPSVSKRVESVFTGTEALAPLDSGATALARFAGQSGGLVWAPFTEQWSPDPWPETGLQTGAVESTLGFDWSRDPGSDWTELVLPLNGSTKLATVRGRASQAEYRSATVSGALQARGINLFGALGSVPLWTWYRTDVWTWSTAGSWGTGTRTTDRNAQASVAARSELVLTTEESLGLPLTYEGRWGTTESQTFAVKPTWSLRHPADLPFELPRWLSAKAFKRQWVQDLSASLTFGWQPTPAPALKDLQISWKGRLLLSDKSEVDLTTKWGQQWTNNLSVVGLEADLDLILSF